MKSLVFASASIRVSTHGAHAYVVNKLMHTHTHTHRRVDKATYNYLLLIVHNAAVTIDTATHAEAHANYALLCNVPYGKVRHHSDASYPLRSLHCSCAGILTVSSIISQVLHTSHWLLNASNKSAKLCIVVTYICGC